MGEPSKDDFKVMRLRELEATYYAPDELPINVRLNPAKVPERLRRLIPLAKEWGVSDDILRARAVAHASADDIAALRATVAEYEDVLEEWLTGPESKCAVLSAEYLAFTNMLMAADGC